MSDILATHRATILSTLKKASSEQKLKAAFLFFGFMTYCLCFQFITDLYIPNVNGYTIRQQLFGDDFVNMWAGSKLFLQGDVLSIFNPEFYNQHLKLLTQNPEYPLHIFSYPPHLLLFVGWFGLFSYFQALMIWSVLGVSAVALLLRHLKCGLSWAFILITSPIIFANLMMGQNGLFTGVLLFGGLMICRKQPILAGILFACLTMKPQLGILIPFVLLLTRNWKCFLSASISTGVLIGLSIAVFGLDAWHGYLFDTLAFQKRYLLESMGVATYYQFMMPGVYANGFLVAEPMRTIFTFLHIIISGAVLYKTFHVVKADKEFAPKTILAICMASALISPYFFNYDLTAVIMATLFYLMQTAKSPAEKPDSLSGLCLMILWTLPLTTLVMRGHFEHDLHVTLSEFFLLPSCVMVGCFYLLFFRNRKITT